MSIAEKKKPNNTNQINHRHVQAKLEIGKPDDRYEKEANTVADRVMRMPAAAPPIFPDNGNADANVQMKCEKCSEEDHIQMMPDGNSQMNVSESFENTLNSTAGAGFSLPETVQSEMGQKIGADFSSVKIHTDDTAVQLSREIGAQAFTHGSDIYFNSGKYNPDSASGKHLLAHELTHTVQQENAIQSKKIQKNEEEAKVLEDLNHRAKGEDNHEFNFDAVNDKFKAAEAADSYFENASGEENFAQNLIQTIDQDLEKAYTQIKEGQKAAINSIQQSIDEQKEKEQMIRSSLLAFVSIVAGWAPLAARAVASTEAKMVAQLEKNFKNVRVRMHPLANKIKEFGESKMLSPWITTIRAVNGVIGKSDSAQETIESNVTELSDKTSFAVHALVLEMGMELKNNSPQKLDASGISSLRSSIYKEIIGIIFPEYQELITKNADFSSISGLAKKQMLKTIILNSARISDSTLFSDSKIEGHRNKEGKSTVEHALKALGGEKELAKQLKNPYEFAFASLNSSLSHMGLSINTTEENKRKARETDYLNENRGFSINIDDILMFKKFLDTKPIVTNNLYIVQSGPIKDMYDKHPGKSGILYSSYTSYEYNYKNIGISDMELWIHPTEYSSVLEGKIKDVKSFKLKFKTSGNANVIEKSVSNGYGVSRKSFGKHEINGMNHIKVLF